MKKYRVDFKLTDEPYCTDEAREYLAKDCLFLTQLLKKDVEFGDKLEKIEWVLKEPRRGYVELTINKELSEKELFVVSDWVSGQNSDGLGEGFESHYGASFDWLKNDYLKWYEVE